MSHIRIYTKICLHIREKELGANMNRDFDAGEFLCDAGWYPDAEQVFCSSLQVLKQMLDDLPSAWKAFDCCIR